jgi:uncharacterized protein YqjF (DUF2071 family)
MMMSVEAEDLAPRQSGGPAAASCPFTVDRPVMRQRWEWLTFLHWAFDPAAVQPLLPASLQVDTFGEMAWVGLVPFFMRVATAGGHAAPWASSFCETNVRTYVRDGAGRTGIWFFSLDAARLGAVAVARATYRLPYHWSSMRLTERGQRTSYACRRLLPGSRHITSRVEVSVGDRYGAAELTARDHFLTARWILFSSSGSWHRSARAWHQPWPLYRARIQAVDDHLIAAAGLPQPDGEPLAHYSPGVDVRIGRPERAR